MLLVKGLCILCFVWRRPQRKNKDTRMRLSVLHRLPFVRCVCLHVSLLGLVLLSWCAKEACVHTNTTKDLAMKDNNVMIFGCFGASGSLSLLVKGMEYPFAIFREHRPRINLAVWGFQGFQLMLLKLCLSRMLYIYM